MTGATSKFIVPKLAAQMEAAQNDPELLSLRPSISLAQVRAQQLVERAQEGFDPDIIKQLDKLWADYRYAVRAEDFAKAEGIAVLIDKTFAKVGEDYKVWVEIYKALDLGRKLRESEADRLVKMGQMISAEDAMALVSRVFQVIRNRVHDPVTLSAIGQDLSRLVDGRVGLDPQPGS